MAWVSVYAYASTLHHQLAAVNSLINARKLGRAEDPGCGPTSGAIYIQARTARRGQARWTQLGTKNRGSSSRYSNCLLSREPSIAWERHALPAKCSIESPQPLTNANVSKVSRHPTLARSRGASRYDLCFILRISRTSATKAIRESTNRATVNPMCPEVDGIS